MIYKVVDRRALGSASIFGRPAAPRPAPRKALGQAAQAALDVTAAQYEKAKGFYERMRVNYPNLSSILGSGKADQAVREAQAAMEAAAQAYSDTTRIST